MKIYIASDHDGFELKNELINYLEENGHSVEDMGPYEFDPKDDYPDYAVPAARKVQQDANTRGILICDNGVGVSVAANKLSGIRAALSWNPKHAVTAREDDNANVLALPGGYIDLATAKEVVRTWLDTDFSGAERHVRRLQKVSELED